GETMLHLCGNRNKRSLAVDIKSPEGSTVIEKLILTTDVLSENFRPGVMDKLGFGYEAVRKINPKIIYAAASGYGQDGPYSKRPGQDLVIQALSGLANINGSENQPPTPVGVSAVDHHGAQILAMSILAALFHRERTGKGSRVDVDLLSAALDLQNESLVCYANGATQSQRPPKNIAGWYFPAPYGIYAVQDGYVAISLGSMESLANAISLPALEEFTSDEVFECKKEIAALIQSAVKDFNTTELEGKLDKEKLWYARVNDYSAVLRDPQVQHNGSFLDVKSAAQTPITLLAHPAKYDGERPGVRFPPQPLGAQTSEILEEIGYSGEEVRRLGETGIVHLG
ncbi:MAG TPA: CoA transferase, partial [Alphaproteobacteria bacterium]|nr:CoA transferase [Alphaproteobacteria bacterium]